jgi:phosphomannomutase
MNTNRKNINPKIIRKYDIRGQVGLSLTNKDAYHLGLCFANYLKDRGLVKFGKVCVAQDTRKHSGELKTHLIQGLREGGMMVIDLGTGPSPLLYFHTKTLEVDGGIMVTGSHNPATDNGFKIMLKEAQVGTDDIIEIANSSIHKATQKAPLGEINLDEKYINRLKEEITVANKLKIGFECLNGAAGTIIKEIAKTLGCQKWLLNADMSGDFSQMSPDPTKPENLENLRKLIQENELDFGIAFDGDVDRIVIVTKDLQAIYGDDIMILLVRDILSKQSGQKVIFDVKCGLNLRNEILKHGGMAIMYKTGHSLIKQKMASEKAVLAGEMSGHIYISDRYYGFDDAIYAAIRVINFLNNSQQTLTEILNSLPKVIKSPEIKISTRNKFARIEEISKHLRESGVEFVKTDGIRLEKPNNSWFLIRASNTEEVLVVKYEAQNEEDFALVKSEVETLLQINS